MNINRLLKRDIWTITILFVTCQCWSAERPVDPDSRYLLHNLHAVLIAGGGDISMNRPAYRNDLAFVYRTLVNNYHYSPDNIHVFCSDGLDPAPDQMDGTNTDPDFDGDGSADIDAAATSLNISTTFDRLLTTLTPEDMLFVFVTSPFVEGSNSDFYLWGEIMSGGTLGLMMNVLNLHTLVTVWVSDNARNFMAALPGTTVAACSYGEDARLLYNQGHEYHDFTYHYFSALNWATPSGEVIDPEANYEIHEEIRVDSICTFIEALLYVIDLRPAYSPQIYEQTRCSLLTRPFLDITLCPGETYHEVVHYYLLPRIQRADVVILLDITSSMGDELFYIKENLLEIVRQLRRYINDLRMAFCVFGDYPQGYDSCGYNSVYGDMFDFPYSCIYPFTDEFEDLKDQIQEIGLISGHDGPECYARALHEMYSDGTLEFRPYAKKIILLVGDNLPHDCDLDELIDESDLPPGRTIPKIKPLQPHQDRVFSTGWDPGRDQILGTADDLDFHSVLMNCIEQNDTILSIFSGDEGYRQYWEYWTPFTGGASFNLVDASQIPVAVSDLVFQAASHISTLTIQMMLPEQDPFYQWLSPLYIEDLTLPTNVFFDLFLQVPQDSACGVNYVEPAVIGDAVLFGSQVVRIDSPDTICECQSTQTPTPIFSPTPVPTDATPTRTPRATSTPTPVPTQRPTYTVTPTPTNVCSSTNVQIIMPSEYFRPGDLCFCRAIVCNAEPEPLDGYPLFILLDVYGSIFFAPSFNQTFDNYLYILPYIPLGQTLVNIIPQFYWPAGVGQAGGIFWYGAITDPSVQHVIGDYGFYQFGWGY